MNNLTVFLEKLKNELPPVFTRKTICQKLGGFYTAGTLRNLDSLGNGPRKIKGKHMVLYERDSFIEWLKGQILTDKRIVKRILHSHRTLETGTADTALKCIVSQYNE